MTEYPPEKVAELIAEARTRMEPHKLSWDGEMIDLLADALEAVTAERDEWEKAYGEAVDREAHLAAVTLPRIYDDRDRLHKAITEALAAPNGFEWDVPPTAKAILRAALDKEGNDDE